MTAIGPTVGVTTPSYAGIPGGASGPPPSTWTLLSKTTLLGSATSSATTPAINTSGANLLVFCVTTAGAAAITSPDSAGNTWGAPAIFRANAGINGAIYLLSNPLTSSSHTITLTSYPAAVLMAFSGAAAATPLDQSNGAVRSTTTYQPGSITPTQANEMLVLMASLNAASSGLSWGSGFTQQGFSDGSVSVYGIGAATLNQAVAAAINPAITLTAAAAGTCIIASFKSAVP